MDGATTDCAAFDETVVFLSHFKDLHDPRQPGKVSYPLDEIRLLCLFAVLAGAECFTEIALFGVKKLVFLRRFRPFTDGTPAHDHLGDILAVLDAEQFQRCFVAWVAALTEMPEGVIAIDGMPVRSWVLPGNTADVARIKQDLHAWRLGRCLFVGDAGMYSADNLVELSRGLGRYVLAVPMHRVKDVEMAVLTRPGRYRKVADNLEVKEVWAGDGKRRKRYVLCFDSAEADRQREHRAQVLAELTAELTLLDERDADHPKAACVLMASRRYETGSALRAGLMAWIGYYNIRRPHSTLAGRTPDEAYRATVTEKLAV